MEQQPPSNQNTQATSNELASTQNQYPQPTYANQQAQGQLPAIPDNYADAAAPPPNNGNLEGAMVPNVEARVVENILPVASLPPHTYKESKDEIRARLMMSNANNRMMQMLHKKETVITGQLTLIYVIMLTLWKAYDNFKSLLTSLAITKALIYSLYDKDNRQNDEMNKLVSENEKITTERDDLKTLVTESATEIINLKTTLAQKESCLRDFELRNVELVTKVEENQSKINLLEDDNKDLREKLDGEKLQTDRLNSKVGELTNEIEGLRNILKEMCLDYYQTKEDCRVAAENFKAKAQSEKRLKEEQISKAQREKRFKEKKVSNAQIHDESDSNMDKNEDETPDPELNDISSEAIDSPRLCGGSKRIFIQENDSSDFGINETIFSKKSKSS